MALNMEIWDLQAALCTAFEARSGFAEDCDSRPEKAGGGGSIPSLAANGIPRRVPTRPHRFAHAGPAPIVAPQTDAQGDDT
jgi:hypothetical protein